MLEESPMKNEDGYSSVTKQSITFPPAALYEILLGYELAWSVYEGYSNPYRTVVYLKLIAIHLQNKIAKHLLKEFLSSRPLCTLILLPNAPCPSLFSSCSHTLDFLFCIKFYLYIVASGSTCFLVVHIGGGCHFWLRVLYSSCLTSVRRIFIDAVLKCRLRHFELADTICSEVPDGHIAIIILWRCP